MSKKVEVNLYELKIKNNDIKVGDKVLVIDNAKRKLPDGVFDFVNSQYIFEVLRVNANGKIDIGYRKRYVNDRKVKVFYFSKKRFSNLNNYDPVAMFLLSLRHIEKFKLLDYPVDYLDVNNKGVFSCLSRRNVQPGVDPFKSPRRQDTRFTRMLNRIVKKEYLTLTQKQIEDFLNRWRVVFDNSMTVKVLEGTDILDAYDYSKISTGWAHSSCANFNHKQRTGNKYKIYTDNVDNIKCLVVYKKGKIMGRRMMFTGVQTVTHGKFKKGETYTVLNAPYCEGGRGSKVDALMVKWAKENGAYLVESLGKLTDIFRIKIKTDYKQANPPWDYFLINFKTSEIAYPSPGNIDNDRQYLQAIINGKSGYDITNQKAITARIKRKKYDGEDFKKLIAEAEAEIDRQQKEIGPDKQKPSRRTMQNRNVFTPRNHWRGAYLARK